jgi:DNA-binding transcriptional ArsR family regulator
MDYFKVSMHVESDLPPEEIEAKLRAIMAKRGIDVESFKATQIKKSGRPATKIPEVEFWLAKRTKPYSVNQFAKYLGVSYVNAYKKLSRLVAAGSVERVKRGGSVEYTNVGPTEH